MLYKNWHVTCQCWCYDFLRQFNTQQFLLWKIKDIYGKAHQWHCFILVSMIPNPTTDSGSVPNVSDHYEIPIKRIKIQSKFAFKGIWIQSATCCCDHGIDPVVLSKLQSIWLNIVCFLQELGLRGGVWSAHKKHYMSSPNPIPEKPEILGFSNGLSLRFVWWLLDRYSTDIGKVMARLCQFIRGYIGTSILFA